MTERHNREPNPEVRQIRHIRRKWGVSRDRALLLAELCYGVSRK